MFLLFGRRSHDTLKDGPTKEPPQQKSEASGTTSLLSSSTVSGGGCGRNCGGELGGDHKSKVDLTSDLLNEATSLLKTLKPRADLRGAPV